MCVMNMKADVSHLPSTYMKCDSGEWACDSWYKHRNFCI